VENNDHFIMGDFARIQTLKNKLVAVGCNGKEYGKKGKKGFLLNLTETTPF
jgi:hypothetical protein